MSDLQIIMLLLLGVIVVGIVVPCVLLKINDGDNQRAAARARLAHYNRRRS